MTGKEMRPREAMGFSEASPRIGKGRGVETRALGQGLSLQPLVIPGTQPRPLQGSLSSLTAENESSKSIRHLGGVRKVTLNLG